MGTFKDLLKNVLLFQEPEQPQEQFILKEYNENQKSSQSPLDNKVNKKASIRRAATSEESTRKKVQISEKNTIIDNKVSKKIDKNLDFLKQKYSFPLSTDIILREFDITIGKQSFKAFIIFINGMTNGIMINDHILQPLLLFTSLEKEENVDNVITYIERNILPQNQLKKSSDYKEIFSDINFGNCVLFVDGSNQALVLDVKSWEHRTVGKPNTEITVRGPQEGFGEILRVNTSLIRKTLLNENLVVENIVLGERSRTPCSIMYLRDLANPDLVNEVRRRLTSLKIDYAVDSGMIEQMIEDSTFMPTPQILSTERPDRVASMITEGRVAIFIDGSPFVLVVPICFFDLLHSPEDSYVRFPYANLMRAIRYFGIFIALLFPAFYVAITTYHQEMIPTSLLLAISSAREKVPFPTIVEIIIMEISFELIREAGIRMPSSIGPTLGIIGALILGQAAVAASIVSPILIIIVAVTGIGSLANPNYALAFGFRFARFIYIFLAAIAGLFGITLGLFIHGIFMASQKSFGVPFLVPYAPRTLGSAENAIVRSPTWKQEKRPEFLNPLDVISQPKISRGWVKGKKP